MADLEVVLGAVAVVVALVLAVVVPEAVVVGALVAPDQTTERDLVIDLLVAAVATGEASLGHVAKIVSSVLCENV